MSNELTVRENAVGIEYCGIMVTTMADMIALSESLAKSDLVPAVYRGKPGNIIAAIQFGREIGLSPMQALQGVAVVNGKPTVYGTTYLAVCHNAPGFRDVVQKVETVSGKLVATCTAKRAGRADVTRVFTQDMAIKAGIWNKNVHAQYPETMLLWRATHLACDTMFADVLKGMPIRENAEVDYDEPKPEPVGATASERLANQLKGTLAVESVETAIEQASTSPAEATNTQNTPNDPQEADSHATAGRGALLWARWQATEGLPQRAESGKGRNELVNASLAAILGDKLATVRIFQHGTPDQLDAVQSFLDATDNAANEVAGVETQAEDVDGMDPTHWDLDDNAPMLEMAAPDADSSATIGAMSR